MPQTKFVLGKALKMGLRPILVPQQGRPRPRRSGPRAERRLRPVRRHGRHATSSSTSRTSTPRASTAGRRWTWTSPTTTWRPLFDLIVDHVPEPKAEASKDEPFQILSVLIESDPFLGRLLTGRIESGKAVPGLAIHALSRDGKEIERGRITKVLAFRGLKRQPIDDAEAGDIVAIAGLSKATVADTLCAHGSHRGPARPADRPADHLDDRLGQRQPAGRPRRRQGAEPRDPRPPAEGSRIQRRHHASPRPPTTTPMKSPAAANCSWAC